MAQSRCLLDRHGRHSSPPDLSKHRISPQSIHTCPQFPSISNKPNAFHWTPLGIELTDHGISKSLWLSFCVKAQLLWGFREALVMEILGMLAWNARSVIGNRAYPPSPCFSFIANKYYLAFQFQLDQFLHPNMAVSCKNQGIDPSLPNCSWQWACS